MNGVDNKDTIVKTDDLKAEEEKVENTATEVPAVASAGDQMETQDWKSHVNLTIPNILFILYVNFWVIAF